MEVVSREISELVTTLQESGVGAEVVLGMGFGYHRLRAAASLQADAAARIAMDYEAAELRIMAAQAGTVSMDNLPEGHTVRMTYDYVPSKFPMSGSGSTKASKRRGSKGRGAKAQWKLEANNWNR